MKSKKAQLILNEINLRYYLGFYSEGYLLTAGEEFVFFTDARYIEEAESKLSFKVVGFTKEPFEEILDYLSDNKIHILLFEKSIRYDLFLALKKKASARGIKIRSAEGITEEKRKIKSAEELKKIRKSAEINDRIFQKILKDIKVGVTELELKNKLEYYLKSYGGSKSSFDLIVLFGERTSRPHGISSEYKLKKNMPILFDIGVEYEGYCSDMTRMVVFGKIEEGFLKDYNFVKAVQEKALENIKSGSLCKDIDLEVRRAFAVNKSQVFHSTGHGVGLEIHERPYLNLKSRDRLKENMVVTAEPGLYLPGKYGIRIEDLVIVKKDGYELLSKTDKDLIFI